MVALIEKILLRIKWLMMSPQERYVYLWNRAGSLRYPRSQLIIKRNR